VFKAAEICENFPNNGEATRVHLHLVSKSGARCKPLSLLPQLSVAFPPVFSYSPFLVTLVQCVCSSARIPKLTPHCLLNLRDSHAASRNMWQMVLSSNSKWRLTFGTRLSVGSGFSLSTFTRKLCFQFSGLRMRNFTWNRFPIKNLLINSLLTPIVESTYLNNHRKYYFKQWFANLQIFRFTGSARSFTLWSLVFSYGKLQDFYVALHLLLKCSHMNKLSGTSFTQRHRVVQGRIQPVSLRGAIPVKFCTQVLLRVHYCKRHEVYSQHCCEKTRRLNGPYIANAVSRVVQNHSEKVTFVGFRGEMTTPESVPGVVQVT